MKIKNKATGILNLISPSPKWKTFVMESRMGITFHLFIMQHFFKQQISFQIICYQFFSQIIPNLKNFFTVQTFTYIKTTLTSIYEPWTFKNIVCGTMKATQRYLLLAALSAPGLKRASDSHTSFEISNVDSPQTLLHYAFHPDS